MNDTLIHTATNTATDTATDTATHISSGRAVGVATGDIGGRLAGLGAITFAAVVLAQNVIRGGSAPANDAPIDEVLTHYADHRGVTFVLVATFVVAAISLITFLAGVWRRIADGPRPTTARAGLLGAIGVVALFSIVVGSEQALSVAAGREGPDAGAIDALWSLHNGVFSVLYLSLAIALFGLGRAGVAAGITPRAFDRLAPLGAGLLVVAAVAGPALAAGEAMPLFALGGIGFLIWLGFLVTTGRRLVRG